jgi:SulP family sulfate permease
MPALAGLLILVGFRTIKPADLSSVWHTGPMQKTVLVVTFVLTVLIPMQYAVLTGVGLSVIMYVIRQSNQVVIRRWVYDDSGSVREVDAPTELPGSEVIVLQPYGSLFFASAPVFEAALPAVRAQSRRSVVILRLRGHAELGRTFMDVLRRYALALAAVGSKLVIVSAGAQIQEQLALAGITDVIGPDGVYAGDERLGAAVRRAYDDAIAWTGNGSRDP